MKWLESLRRWLILRLGGYWDNSARAHARSLLVSLPPTVIGCAAQSCEKVWTDPSFKVYEGSNLGREIRRDEAAEWAKLYLKDLGLSYRDSDVHLACELIHFLDYRRN